MLPLGIHDADDAMSRLTTHVGRAAALSLVLAIGATAAAAQGVPARSLISVPAALAGPLGLQIPGGLGGLFDLSVGIDRISDHVDDLVMEFEDQFSDWANTLYASLFLLQFLLIGATMVVRGPFALTSARPVSALGPFANFFFFLIAGAFGYLLVANSFYMDGDNYRGWVPWLYDFFSEAGYATGCEGTDDPGIGPLTFDKCSPDELASVGMRLSGVMMALAQNGSSPQNGINTLVNTFGASTGVFSAFSVLAIQMALTQIAFKLAIVAAPLFLATLIFRPISGISTGFLTFVLYLGVKLAVLYLVAGLASFVADEWLRAMAYTVLLSLATGGASSGPGAAGLFSYHLSVLTVSMLLLGLTLYLPARIAGSVTGAFRLDLNALLFRGELPIQTD